MINSHRTVPSGFTLVETLVAVTILTVAIVGPLYESVRAYQNSLAARDQLTASMLAQEAAERIHAIRDSNYLYSIDNPGSPHTWLYGLSGCISAPCTIDSLLTSPNDVSTTIRPLYINTRYLYNQKVTADSKLTRFTRTIRLATVPGNPNEMKIMVTVTWTNRAGNQTATVVDYLDNWL